MTITLIYFSVMTFLAITKRNMRCNCFIRCTYNYGSKGVAKLFSKMKSSNNVSYLRLERILSNRGVGSRNDVSKLLRQGRVKINGEVVLGGANKYPSNVEVDIDGQIITSVPILALYHKPIGVISTMGDPWGRDGLEELSLDWPFLKTMHPVGRLDADTSGLLLFSSDGHLTQTLLHPASDVEREYEAIVIGKVDYEALSSKLGSGIKTTEGTFSAKLLHAEIVDENIDISTIKDLPPDFLPSNDESNDIKSQSKTMPASLIRLVVTEGKYRMVRRVMHNAGHSVVKLHRLRYGSILLADLEEGEVRPCTAEEALWASGVAKLKSSKSKSEIISSSHQEE